VNGSRGAVSNSGVGSGAKLEHPARAIIPVRMDIDPILNPLEIIIRPP
jgi:hypothetical protein